MIVLRIVGLLLLAVLVLGLALLILALALPVRIEVRRKMPDGPLRLRVGYGPLKKVFAPGKKRGKAKKQEAKPKKPKKPKEQGEKKTARSFSMENLDWSEALALVLDLLDDLTGAITWERLHVTVLLHLEDAAKTGILLGELCAAVGNLYPFLERAFVLRDTKITLDADFDAERTIWGLDLSLMTRLGRFPPVLWKYRKRLLRLWKSVAGAGNKPAGNQRAEERK